MLVHSSTIAPMSAWRETSVRPASRMSAAASATSMSCFSPRTSTRKNSRPSSVPTNGVSGGTPAAARCRGSATGGHRDDANAPARRQQRLHPGHLDQCAGCNRYANMRRQFRLEQRQKAAVGGDRLGPVGAPVRRQRPGSHPAARPRRSAPRVPASRREPRGRAPGTARLWRCPCRLGCAGTVPPA